MEKDTRNTYIITNNVTLKEHIVKADDEIEMAYEFIKSFGNKVVTLEHIEFFKSAYTWKLDVIGWL